MDSDIVRQLEQELEEKDREIRRLRNRLDRAYEEHHREREEFKDELNRVRKSMMDDFNKTYFAKVSKMEKEIKRLKSKLGEAGSSSAAGSSFSTVRPISRVPVKAVGRVSTIKFGRPRQENDDEPTLTNDEKLIMAARHGNFNSVQLLADNVSNMCYDKAIEEAAINGHIEIVKYLARKRNSYCNMLHLPRLAAVGKLDGFESLVQQGDIIFDEGDLMTAIDAGNASSVEWLLNNVSWLAEADVINDALAHAIEKEKFTIATMLMDEYSAQCSSNLLDAAVRTGKASIVKWIHTYCPEILNETVISNAINKLKRNNYNGKYDELIVILSSMM